MVGRSWCRTAAGKEKAASSAYPDATTGRAVSTARPVACCVQKTVAFCITVALP
jgi:hypothetical protein